MGEAPHSIVLVEDEADVAALTFPPDAKLAYLTQTTLSVDETTGIIAALRAKYPQIVGPAKDDICYATQNRQEAVKDLVPRPTWCWCSAARTARTASGWRRSAGSAASRRYLIDTRRATFATTGSGPTTTVLITAGASAPEEHVQECVELPAAAIRGDGRDADGARGARQLPAAAGAAGCSANS